MNSKLPIVAIVGRANVGKSSLFNRLVGKREAIVFDKPGTTRDRVVSKADFNDKTAWLVDTAGKKTPEDDFELNIQQQIDQATESADVIVLTVEANVGVTNEDRDVAKKALKTKKPVILVLNKVDKAKKSDLDTFKSLGIKQVVEVSTVHTTGLEELESAISDLLPKVKAEESKAIRLAIVGRPNVGKSKLFNQMVNEERAVVSDVAGTTRDANRATLTFDDQEIEIIDTAGVRRSGKSAKDIEYFSSLRTLAAIDNSDVCVLLIDSTEPLTKLDMKIAGMVKEAGKGLILALSKWDLVNADDDTFDRLARTIGHEYQFVNWAPLIITSADEKKNLKRLLKIGVDIYFSRKLALQTKKLNSWLLETTSHHPPAGLKNTQPKLKYVTQVGSNPPTFRFFGRDMKTLHWSYKRYLERQLREEFGIEGTAIALEFSEDESGKKN